VFKEFVNSKFMRIDNHCCCDCEEPTEQGSIMVKLYAVILVCRFLLGEGE